MHECKGQNMTEPTSSVGSFLALKAYGFKAALGMGAAVLLYLALPPVDKDGSFNEREFIFRLLASGLFAMIFGDWAVAIIDNTLPYLLAKQYPAPVYFFVGAPAWWLSRAVALWFKRNENKDIEQVYDHFQNKDEKDQESK